MNRLTGEVATQRDSGRKTGRGRLGKEGGVTGVDSHSSVGQGPITHGKIIEREITNVQFIANNKRRE